MHVRIATTNAHKLDEFRQLLTPFGHTVSGVEDIAGYHVDEDGETFADNARKKAETLAALTGESALADDSGLEVDALGGAPGVRSARYSGVSGAGQDAANRHKLLHALRDVPAEQRQARFVCVLAFAQPSAPTRLFNGTLSGRIATVERGHAGFGYDPVFWLPEQQQTVAELSPAQKHALSHRGRAAQKLLAFLHGSNGN